LGNEKMDLSLIIIFLSKVGLFVKFFNNLPFPPSCGISGNQFLLALSARVTVCCAAAGTAVFGDAACSYPAAA